MRIALAALLVIGVVAVAVTMSGSPIRVSAVNTATAEPILSASSAASACQPGESLPRGTSGIRMRAETFLGPRVTASVSVGGRVIAHGEHGAGWTGGAVTVPVKPLPVSYSDATVCFKVFLNGHESASFQGEPARVVKVKGKATKLPPRVRLEYMSRGRSSWWAQARQVARRMGLGHAPSGTWVVLLVLLAMMGLVALCSGLILQELEQ